MENLKRYCLALDLVDDPEVFAAYEEHHRHVSPEIQASIREAGIERMDIFRAGNRLFMIMDVDSSFSFERKEAMDAANSRVQVWEALMWKYQQRLPFAAPGEKWVVMKQIFELST